MTKYKNWKKKDEVHREKNTEQWQSDWYSSDWYSSDGDAVELFFTERENYLTIDLYCFSGIPASYIHVDSVDFGRFSHEINLKKDKKYTQKEIALEVADYLCGLFCEKL